MRVPGDPDCGSRRGRAVYSPAETNTADADAARPAPDAIFPKQTADGRARQLEETWQVLFRELRGPVDSTLLGGLSAGDVAYRLGELVHNYFRTRGVTLASFELRRIVVELLENHKRGWPTLKAAQQPDAPPSSLVDFVDGDPDARAIREAASLSPRPVAARPVEAARIEAVPSPLVEVEPRGRASEGMSAIDLGEAAPPVTRAAPGRSAPRRRAIPDAARRFDREDTLTPEQLASMEAAAADAAEAAFGGETSEPVTVHMPPRVQPAATAASTDLSAEAAWPAIFAAWDRLRGLNPPPAARADLRRWLLQVTAQALSASHVRVAPAERGRLEQLIMDDVFGLGPIEPLLRDAATTSIMINGPDAVFVERRGQIERAGGFRDAAHLVAVLERLTQHAGVPAPGLTSPVIEGRLPDASRFVIVSPPLAPAGPLCTIVRRPAPADTLDDLAGREALSQAMARLLHAAVRGRLNILVSGAADSGRTTMLSALARAIGASERVVTVERRPELRLDLGNVVSLVAPEAGPEMVPAIDFAMAVSAASRLRPDRLVIDGLGNGAVAALVTLIDGGRDGVVASCEAASPGSALDELARHIVGSESHETLEAARRRVAGAFDLVVHLEAFRDTRRVTHLAEVTSVDGEGVACRDLFAYEPGPGRGDELQGRFSNTGRRPAFLARLARAGLDQAVIDDL